MNIVSNFYLTWIALSPLLGLIAILFINREKEAWIKRVGIVATFIPLILSIILFTNFKFDQTGYQFVEQRDWIHFQMLPWLQQQMIEIRYELGVDGLSVSLILLTAILSTLAAVASIYIKQRWKEYFILFFILQVGMLGVFMAQNLFLFFIFFELTIIPTFFLIGIWGFANREKAANSFLIYNGIGSAAMLIAFVILLMMTGTLNIEQLNQYLNVQGVPAGTLMMGLFITLLFAFGVKLPIFPLHSWMLRVHVEAPPAIVMIHSGILLKLGAYGLIRIGAGIFPEQLQQLSFFLAVLGVVNILYGAVLAFVQRDLKMVLAYSSISHMGIVLLGIAALNYSGLQGAIFQAISHGIISALLFFLIGVIYERTQTTMIDQLGGLAKSMPIISGVLLLAAMANLGLPGMSGFISEFLAFLGLFNTYPWVAAVGVLGIILTAVYLLRAVLQSTFGPAKEKWANLEDAKGFEVVPMAIFVGLIILIGIYPSILSETIHLSVENLVHSLTARIGG